MTKENRDIKNIMATSLSKLIDALQLPLSQESQKSGQYSDPASGSECEDDCKKKDCPKCSKKKK